MTSSAAIGHLVVANDMRPAEWLRHRLHETPLDVASIVPGGFESYARIFHPAYTYDMTTGDVSSRLSWSEFARKTRKSAHPLMQWEYIRPAARDFQEPSIGTLTPGLASALAAVLSRHTAEDSRCWFGAWTGRQPLLIPEESPRFSLPVREMFLLRGRVSDLEQNLAPAPLTVLPSIAWPEDYSWVIATDADLRSTYLAASKACVQDVLRQNDIEAHEVASTDLVTLESDTVNSAND